MEETQERKYTQQRKEKNCAGDNEKGRQTKIEGKADGGEEK